MSPQQSQEAKELQDVLDNLKTIAEEQTEPGFRTFAEILNIEIVFSIVAFVVLIFGLINQDTLGELGLPTTLVSVGTLWVKSLKDGYDKAMSLADNRHNNFVFSNLMETRIKILDNIQDQVERKNEIDDIKEQLAGWCKSLVGKYSSRCPYT
ncbi:MAG: hypothetical protein ACW99U_14085 [Candidatus Thorarchaeota archaeon]